MDSESDRRALLSALGGQDAITDRGLVLGILDNESSEALDIEGTVPVFTCQTCDVERYQLRKGALLNYAGMAYRVRRHEPDGTGMSRLILEG